MESGADPGTTGFITANGADPASRGRRVLGARMRTIPVLGVVVFLLMAAARAGAVEVTDYAIYSEGDVKIKGDVGGDVGSAAGSVKLQGGSLVAGDVNAAGQVRTSGDVVVKGIITPHDGARPGACAR